MREEDSNWFSKWEEELPSPEELMPLSQSLITRDLALAFDIRNPNHHQPYTPPSAAMQQQISQQPSLAEFAADSGDLGSGGAGDESARTLKRPRLVWTPQLHKRFVDAVAHLGIKNAVPKTIMQLMSVDGLTRENVASHLQKYRLYLKRMQRLSSGGGGSAGLNTTADDHLFASSPVPPHFLHPGGRGSSDHFLPFVAAPPALQHHHHQQIVAAPPALQHHHHQQIVAEPPALQHHHHQQIVAEPPALQHHHHQQIVAAAVGHPDLQSQYHRPQMGHYGSSPNSQFDHHFLGRQIPQRMQNTRGIPMHSQAPSSYVKDLESASGNGGRKILTLFPNGDD